GLGRQVRARRQSGRPAGGGGGARQRGRVRARREGRRRRLRLRGAAASGAEGVLRPGARLPHAALTGTDPAALRTRGRTVESAFRAAAVRWDHPCSTGGLTVLGGRCTAYPPIGPGRPVAPLVMGERVQ